jgi:hypothetical protein
VAKPHAALKFAVVGARFDAEAAVLIANATCPDFSVAGHRSRSHEGHRDHNMFQV